MRHAAGRIAAGIFAVIVFIGIELTAFPVFADSYIANDILGTQKIAKTFEAVRFIDDFTQIGDLSTPMDLFIDENDYTYLLDSENSRILVYDPEDQLNRIIGGKDVLYGEDNQAMNKPEGLFVDGLGDVFVADTENERVLHLDKEGRFVEEFFEPDHPTYDNSFPFKPTKVAVDAFGRLYITNAYDYHGIILMDGDNEFLGYIASTKITTSFFDTLINLFASEAQKEMLARELPAYFSNFLLKDNFIYATSYWMETEQIRKMTPAGGNVYPSKVYGEKNESDQYNYLPAFVDLAVDDNGIVYAAESVTGQIYVYDTEGNNLSIFGGKGNTYERFDSISSIAVNSKGEVYTLDKVSNIVRIFRPTELMEKIFSATALYQNGDYDGARDVWNEVLEEDATNYLANMGIAKAAAREGKYAEAMELYRDSMDSPGYSEAFYNYRLELFREWFIPVVLVAVVLVVLLVFGLGRLRWVADDIYEDGIIVRKRKMGPTGYLKIGLMMFYHPMGAMEEIKKKRGQLSYAAPIILFFVMLAAHLGYTYLVHFPLSDVTLIYSGLWSQLGMLVLLLVSFLIVGHILISLSDGKQTYKEMLTASMFSFLPYILLILPLGAISHLLCQNESGLYYALVSALWIWSIGLLLLSVKIMNEYSFARLVWTVAKVLFGIVCFWMIIALLFIVVYQACTLFEDIYKEYMIRFV